MGPQQSPLAHSFVLSTLICALYFPNRVESTPLASLRHRFSSDRFSTSCHRRRLGSRLGRSIPRIPSKSRLPLSDDKAIGRVESSLSRRKFVDISLASLFLAASQQARAEESATGGSDDNIPPPRKLDKVDFRSVPAFAVTDESGSSPYFTDESPTGQPAGFFFLERKDAERILKTVQKEDPKAKVTTIPFTEAVAFVENKGVNFGGEFHVLPSPREIANANNVRLLGHDQAFLKLGKKLQSKDAYDMVPCFYEEKLASVIDGKPTVLAFLKYDDLQAVWEDQTAGVQGEVPEFSPKVLSFNELLDKQREPDTPNVLIVSSESFEDVEHLQ